MEMSDVQVSAAHAVCNAHHWPRNVASEVVDDMHHISCMVEPMRFEGVNTFHSLHVTFTWLCAALTFLAKDVFVKHAAGAVVGRVDEPYCANIAALRSQLKQQVVPQRLEGLTRDSIRVAAEYCYRWIAMGHSKRLQRRVLLDREPQSHIGSGRARGRRELANMRRVNNMFLDFEVSGRHVCRPCAGTKPVPRVAEQ